MDLPNNFQITVCEVSILNLYTCLEAKFHCTPLIIYSSQISLHPLALYSGQISLHPLTLYSGLTLCLHPVTHISLKM